MSRKKKSAKAVPITDAKTIAEFVAAANRDFDLQLPESWPAGSVAADIWALPVTVKATEDDGGYVATAKKAYPNLGTGDAAFEGRISAVLTRTGNVYLRNYPGDDPLSSAGPRDQPKET
ncbi:hypothetical protein [Citreimonas sp.]|uniref:hypothetical protein n=1 Tax=Citreimonas sp. TaxID=3036715 RepID=UPI00405907AC